MTIAIQVKNLHKIYGKGDQKYEAVKGISLSINKGELFGFLGPNGAGKTTSLKMMVGLLEPTQGSVEILGKDPKEQNNDLKSQLGIIPQEISVYQELTVEENLKFMASIYKIPKDIAQPRIEDLITRIGLDEKRKTRAKNLSGGQRRRLNFVMSLIHDPQIILCDEPTSGLDPQSRIVVWDFIQDLTMKHKKTVVLTTHFMEEADRLADRVAIIDKGEILVLDKPERLKASIGEGDLLELEINDPTKLEQAKKALNNFRGVQNISISSGNLLIRALNVIPKISQLLNIVEDLGVEITNMSVRNTSLEDVFIHLTGRHLRN